MLALEPLCLCHGRAVFAGVLSCDSSGELGLLPLRRFEPGSMYFGNQGIEASFPDCCCREFNKALCWRSCCWSS